MSCDEIRELLPEFWSRTIRMNDHAIVERHLAECESCRNESAHLSSLWERLDLIPVEAPGPGLRPRFYEALEAYRRGQEEAPRERHAQRSWFSAFAPTVMAWQFAAAAAALFAVGLLVGHSIDLKQESGAKLTANEQIGQLRKEVDHMRQLVALSLLQQESASDRLRGVNWAYRVQKSDTEVVTALLNTVHEDPSVNVRLAAVDALRPFGSTSPLVRKAIGQSLFKQDSPMVQIALIDLLVDLKDQPSRALIRNLSENPAAASEVRERAREASAELK